jgi:hypothetical protein
MRFGLMRRVAGRIFPGYRFEWPHLSWWRDDDFNRYLDHFAEREGFNTARRWTLYQMTRLVASVPGDTAECGVFQGAGSFLIAKSLQRSGSNLPRTHFVFDSFEGLSDPSAADGNAWRRGDLSCSLERVQGVLGSLPNVKLYKGWIPKPFVHAAEARFAFVHIDVDLYEPTRDSITFFYPRMNEGGIIVCDDYGFTTCPGATQAIDDFLADKQERMISLASGGGFLIKGRQTGASQRLFDQNGD